MLLDWSKLRQDASLNYIIDLILSSISTLPMESLWEALSRVLGEEVISALNSISSEDPNLDHAMIAVACEIFPAHLIFTLNFDALHEKAVEQYTELDPVSLTNSTHFIPVSRSVINDLSLSYTCYIIHLHGSLGTQNSYREIVSTVSSTGTLLPASKRRILEEALERYDIICAGYSNNDVDTIPLILQTQNRLFWYSHSGSIPEQVKEFANRFPERYIQIRRNNDEQGFGDVLLSSSHELAAKASERLIFLRRKINVQNHQAHLRSILVQLTQNISQFLEEPNTSEVRVGRTILAIILDEIGKREDALRLINSDIEAYPASSNLLYAEMMLRGHNRDRLGEPRIAIKEYSQAAKCAPTRSQHALADILASSAALGTWKRNPILICMLLRWIMSILRWAGNNLEAIDQIYLWELADFCHHISEFLLFPSSFKAYIDNEFAFSNKRPIVFIDYLLFNLLGFLRIFLLRKATYLYMKLIRLGISREKDLHPEYTSLGIYRVIEVMAALGKHSQARYILNNLASRSDRFYKWSHSEHGQANSICARGVAYLYSGEIHAALDLFQKARLMHGSHKSGQLKADIYIYRARYWGWLTTS
jgi:tetratricopeptide (TPR) repeat protein